MKKASVMLAPKNMQIHEVFDQNHATRKSTDFFPLPPSLYFVTVMLVFYSVCFTYITRYINLTFGNKGSLFIVCSFSTGLENSPELGN